MAPKRTLTVNNGDVYNDLKVIREVEPRITRCSINGKRYTRMVECECKCGTIKTVSLNNLVSGKTKSCGCYSYREDKPDRNYKRKKNHNNMVMINRVGKTKSKSGYYGIFAVDKDNEYYEATVVEDGARIDIGYGKDPIQLNERRLKYLQDNNLKYKVV